MTEQPSDGGLQIDSDWKVEAAREKERLVAEERKQRDSGKAGGEPGANILELVNLVAMQAAIGLGGFDGPGGERIAPNLGAAIHRLYHDTRRPVRVALRRPSGPRWTGRNPCFTVSYEVTYRHQIRV